MSAPSFTKYPKKKDKRIGGKKRTETISLYNLSNSAIKTVLEAMEVEDLKNLCRHLQLSVSGKKASLVRRIDLSDKINSVAFLTGTKK